MKHRLYRLLISSVRLLYFIAACIVVFPQWKKWKNSSKYSSSFWRVSALVVRTIVVPRRGASLNRLSLPVSSHCHSFPGKTWDALLFPHWFKGRENPLTSLSLYSKLILYFANLAVRSGCVSVSYEIFANMQRSKNHTAKLLGMLGQLDIAILIQIWSEQLAPFYQASIWFNPDTVEGFRDDLSDLFERVRPERIDELYHELISLAPKLAVAHEMYGEYCESLLQAKQALAAYQAGCVSNPESVSLMRRNKMLSLLVDSPAPEPEAIPFVSTVTARIASAAAICLEAGWLYEKMGNNEKAAYAFDLLLGGQFFRREVQLEIPAHALVFCRNSILLDGGLVLSHSNGEYYVISDSKHLDIRHLKLFTPQLVAHDREKALIQIPPELGGSVCQKAFIVTGAGWNYYHWLYETIPYIDVYEASGCWEKMPLFFPFPLTRWHKETINLLGCGHFDILPYKTKPAVFKECVFPTHSSRDLVPSPSAIKFLRERLAKPRVVKSGKRVFLSRSGVRAVRGMRNRADISKWMSKHGFVLLDPSKMSISEQVEFFSDVEFVAAEGGAALSNLVFCPADTKIIVMAASRAWAETFSTIAGELGQQMVTVLGDSHPKPNPYYLWTAFDYSIATKDLDMAFNHLMQH